MRKLFKIVFSRMWLVAFAIIAQLILSTALPYLLNYWHPEIFGKLYIQIDLIFNIIGLVMLLIIVNSDMIAEGKLAWVVLFLIFPLFAFIIYRMFVWYKAPKRHRRFYVQVKNKVAEINKTNTKEKAYLKENIGKHFGQFEYIYKATDLKTYSNSNVKYLNSGESFYQELLQELEQAKS